MDLLEIRQRIRRVLWAQAVLEAWERVSVADVSIRQAPSSEPGATAFTITPTDDGSWRADYWYSEAGGTRPVAGVTSSTIAAALDWVWWYSTRDYFTRCVVPAAEQWDRKMHATKRELGELGVLRPGAKKRGQRGLLSRASGQWADEMTNRVRLGIAARLWALTSSATAMRLARNPRTPSWALATMRFNRHPAVRWQLAGNPATPPAVLRYLGELGDFGARWYLADRPSTSTTDLVTWARTDSALWSAVLDRDDVPSSELARIDLASSGALRRRMIEHRAASPELLSRFARECDASLGIALLESGRFAPDDLEAILGRASGWHEWSVGRELGARSLPLDGVTARRLAHESTEQARMLAAVSAGLPPTDRDVLAADPSMSVRKVVAAASATPALLLAALAKDDEWPVREAAATNHAVDPALLEQLAFDGQRLVRWAAIRNPALTREVLDRLLGDDDREVATAARSALARRG